MTQIWWQVLVSALLIYGAYVDVRARRIPNWVSLALLCVGLVVCLLLNGWEVLPWRVLHVGIALAVGMVLFAWKTIGAGDAKFYTGLAASISIQDGLTIAALVTGSGVILAIGFLVFRSKLKKIAQDRNPDFVKVPYGAAIAMGGLIGLWWL